MGKPGYFCALFLAPGRAAAGLPVVFVLEVAVLVSVPTALLAAEPMSAAFCVGTPAALSTAELTCDCEVCTPLSTAQFKVSPKPSTVFCALPFSLSLNEENTPPFVCWVGAGAAGEGC